MPQVSDGFLLARAASLHFCRSVPALIFILRCHGVKIFFRELIHQASILSSLASDVFVLQCSAGSILTPARRLSFSCSHPTQEVHRYLADMRSRPIFPGWYSMQMSRSSVETQDRVHTSKVNRINLKLGPQVFKVSAYGLSDSFRPQSGRASWREFKF